jgi:hypothetical protein
MLAQRIEQRRANVECKPPLIGIDLEGHVGSVAYTPVELACGGGFRDQGARRNRRGRRSSYGWA